MISISIRRFVLFGSIILLVAAFLQSYPGAARADNYLPGPSGTVLAMAGMTDEEMAAERAAAEGPPQIPAGRPSDPGYQPVQKAADDSSMALVAALVFGLPVGLWMIFRALKKSKKG